MALSRVSSRREAFGNSQQNNNYGGRVISVNWERVTREIGIDGSTEAIKETIKAVFNLRTDRAFWLEDGNCIARTIDRDMPQGNYTLHVDEGLMIKLCSFDEMKDVHRWSPGYVPPNTAKTFYTDDDLRDFLSRRDWICLREINSSRNVEVLDELQHGGIYCGISHAQSSVNASFRDRTSDDDYYR